MTSTADTRHAPGDDSIRLRTRRLAITVRGVVQGVGFRPFIYREATERGLTGWVRNGSSGVRIEAQGPPEVLQSLLAAVRDEHPPHASISSIEVEPMAPIREEAFTIVPSAVGDAPRPAIPADLATCPDCLQEIHDPSARRYAYPFTNCTCCGPRYSIIESLPYDRPRTAMQGFTMCPDCEAEYRNPGDRRFHAQPIACPQCGPHLALLDASGSQVQQRELALTAAAAALARGEIVALKGIGGFQLLVDATDEHAVARLRRRKRREAKPFAVMMTDLDEVRRHCEVDEEGENLLASAEAPILLLWRRQPEGQPALAPGVAPGNPRLGVLLPYSPLHHLLMATVRRPLVCTSGNLSDEPICTDNRQALQHLGNVADLLLVHDRPVVRPVDDSVARLHDGSLQLLRRARGFAPRPLDLAVELPPTLALGGHLKSTIAVGLGSQAVVSQHLGDLDDAECREAYVRTVHELLTFFRMEPQALACDLHPDYASTRLAEDLAARWGLPLYRIQHHHAHVAAVMAEHGLEGEILGLAWDGTGYGTDGTAWGGETLLCKGTSFTRVASLRPFPLPGGDRAAREPRRSALGLLHAAWGDDGLRHAEEMFEPHEMRVLRGALARSVNAPLTSSVGRLFDAVAALLGLGARARYEGEAAMACEFAMFGLPDHPGDAGAYPMPLRAERTGQPRLVDWEPALAALLDDRARGVSAGVMAARFHNALVEGAVRVVAEAGLPPGACVALGGGCFQNGWLIEQITTRLQADGFHVLTNRRVPPNDGCISLGQLLLAGTIHASQTAG